MFVCYGNVDRSVMACALARHACEAGAGGGGGAAAVAVPRESDAGGGGGTGGLLAPAALVVDCAGVAAIDGRTVTPATHPRWRTPAILREYGIDLPAHTSRRVTPAMLSQADAIYCADSYVLEEVREQLPEARAGVAQLMTSLLEGRERDTDVGDPIGGPIEEFR